MPDVVRLTYGASLTYEHFRNVRWVLTHKGVCILPSDTGYSLASLISIPGVPEKVCRILGRGNEPISLSFGTLSQVESFAELSAKDWRVLDLHCPGPITLVCKLREDANPDWREGTQRGQAKGSELYFRINPCYTEQPWHDHYVSSSKGPCTTSHLVAMRDRTSF